MQRRVVFDGRVLPYLLLAPQLLITVVFFFWPAAQAVYYSFMLQDAFGLRQNFVWFDNYRVVLADPLYRGAVARTLVFTVAVTLLSMAPALLLAVMADKRSPPRWPRCSGSSSSTRPSDSWGRRCASSASSGTTSSTGSRRCSWWCSRRAGSR
jgi:ABC-type polysaccharide transport system permease subunit